MALEICPSLPKLETDFSMVSTIALNLPETEFSLSIPKPKKPIRLKPKRGNFQNCFRNPCHDKIVFTESEKLFKEILESHAIKFIHEHFVKFNVDTHKNHYWLDFFIPDKRLSIEINPSWHFKNDSEVAKQVFNRDKIKRYLLKTRMHIEQLEIRVKGIVKKGKWKPTLNQKDLRKVINRIKNTPISRETLTFYL